MENLGRKKVKYIISFSNKPKSGLSQELKLYFLHKLKLGNVKVKNLGRKNVKYNIFLSKSALARTSAGEPNRTELHEKDNHDKPKSVLSAEKPESEMNPQTKPKTNLKCYRPRTGPKLEWAG